MTTSEIIPSPPDTLERYRRACHQDLDDLSARQLWVEGEVIAPFLSHALWRRGRRRPVVRNAVNGDFVNAVDWAIERLLLLERALEKRARAGVSLRFPASVTRGAPARANIPPAKVPSPPPARHVPPSIQLTRLTDLIAEPDEAILWRVEDRLAFGSVNLLAGKPKGRKSTLARALALEVARGGRWLGHRCHQGRVVYLALEYKRSEVRRHFRAICATGDEPLEFLIDSAPKGLLARLASIGQSGERPDLLIVDTAQRLLAVKDANDYAAVTAAFEPILAFARRQYTCIVLVHHTGKVDRAGLEAVMGSTAWAASVDNLLILNRRERSRLLSTVQRIGPDLDETVVLMDEDTGEVRFGGSRYMVDLQHVVATMRGLVAAAGPDGVGREELLRDIEARRDLKLKALQHLTSDRTVERLGAGTKNNQYRYRDAREPETGHDAISRATLRRQPRAWLCAQREPSTEAMRWQYQDMRASVQPRELREVRQ